MTTLIDTTSPLYLRRLARELNSLQDGFYLCNADKWGGNTRCSRAWFGPKTGQLFIVPCGNLGLRPAPIGAEFIDAYGRSVVASRRAGK
jgi:hypothetical protein